MGERLKQTWIDKRLAPTAWHEHNQEAAAIMIARVFCSLNIYPQPLAPRFILIALSLQQVARVSTGTLSLPSGTNWSKTCLSECYDLFVHARSRSCDCASIHYLHRSVCLSLSRTSQNVIYEYSASSILQRSLLCVGV